jgi:tRNA(fMet)-specific endonuclease VapC
MLKYMLDTDICIFAIKNQPLEVKRAFDHHYGQFCISSVTAMELVFGAEKSSNVEGNLTVIEGFMAHLDVSEYDKAAAHHHSSKKWFCSIVPFGHWFRLAKFIN